MSRPSVAAGVLQSFYDHAPLMMGVVELCDGDVRHLTDNAATGAFFGVEAGVLSGRLSGGELGTPPEVLATWLDAYRRCRDERGPVRFSYRHATPEGERWLSVVVAPAGRGKDGAERCLYVAEDATARKTAEDALRDTTARLGAVLDSVRGGVLVEALDGRVVLANQTFCDLFGVCANPSEAVGRCGGDLAEAIGRAAADRRAYRTRLGEVRRAVEAVVGDTVALADGRTIERDCVPVCCDETGAVLSRLWQFRDVTARTEAARQIEESEARYRLLAENGHDLVCLHDADGTYRWVSPSSASMLGYPPETLAGTKPYDWFHPEDRERILGGHESPARHRKGVRTVRYRMLHHDGHYVWLETIRTPILDDTGGVVGFQSVSRDVTAQCEMEAALIREAHYDALTGLPNRLLFRSHLERRAAEADVRPFALLFLDLDRFKVVNDTLGHTAGDALLREAARRLAACLGPEDTVARFGGDEFAVLLDTAEAGEAACLAEQLLDVLAQPFGIDGQAIHASGSVGFVEVGDGLADPADVLRAADLAMYEAKRRGRAVCVPFDTDMEAAARRRLRLEVDLRDAAERSELHLVYQPIVRLGDGRLVSFEALLRWDHPELGAISPAEFVAIAEESGQSDTLDAWVLDAGCRQMRAWQDAAGRPLPFTLSLNASGSGLHRPVSADLMLDTVERHGLDPDRVQIEITESLFIGDPDAVSHVLERLRARGVRIALDDFGTGYSSLRLLHALPVDVVKIDRSFVGRMDDDPQAGALVEAVVRMSEVLGKTVVAEGIETATQLSVLRDLGSASGQGYLFARPLSVAQATVVALDGETSWAGFWPTGAAA